MLFYYIKRVKEKKGMGKRKKATLFFELFDSILLAYLRKAELGRSLSICFRLLDSFVIGVVRFLNLRRLYETPIIQAMMEYGSEIVGMARDYRAVPWRAGIFYFLLCLFFFCFLRSHIIFLMVGFDAVDPFCNCRVCVCDTNEIYPSDFALYIHL